MTTATKTTPALHDIRPESENLRQEVLAGLRQTPKQLPCKLFYDERGSQLFNQICELEEYYPTRTEKAIMEDSIEEMANLIGPNTALIEYGSGSSDKIKILLDHLPHLGAYVPVDISIDHLKQAAAQIAFLYPHVEVVPVSADYTHHLEIPPLPNTISHRVVYFPGSTIGNFHPQEAALFLQKIAQECGAHGGLLIGVDLKKDTAVLNLAYNDPLGVTAAFNLNILTHLNCELGMDFQEEQFQHEAFYNEAMGRIEMHLVSLRQQVVHLSGTAVTLAANERIWTESSYKYSLPEFAALAISAGFYVDKVWTDPQNLFSVQYLTVVA